MHAIRTAIEIEAPPAVVWSVLSQLDRYGEWNPFIVSAAGRLALGERLTNKLRPPGGRTMTFKPKITVIEEGRTLEWLGHLGLPRVFDGRHRFALEPTATGTRFVHEETFTGVLVPFMRRSIDGRTREGLMAMNSALKARAEAAVRERS